MVVGWPEEKKCLWRKEEVRAESDKEAKGGEEDEGGCRGRACCYVAFLSVRTWLLACVICLFGLFGLFGCVNWCLVMRLLLEVL